MFNLLLCPPFSQLGPFFQSILLAKTVQHCKLSEPLKINKLKGAMSYLFLTHLIILVQPGQH